MALPKIDTPIYDVKLPFTKKTINYRPFLVKEQKILMMALESGEPETIERSIKQIVNNCTIGDIDIDTLPLIDVEYYFYKLRARSIGEIVESKYKCNNIVDDKTCGFIMDVSLNLLEDINIEDKILNNNIKLTDDIGVVLKYPDLKVAKSIKGLSLVDVSFDMIVECIESVYDAESVYPASEATKEELIEFLESLSQQQFESICSYFENLPTIKTNKEVICSKCGYHHEIEVEGLTNFFV